MSDQIASTVVTALAVILAAVTNLYLVAAVSFALLIYNFVKIIMELRWIVRRIPLPDVREDFARIGALFAFVAFIALRLFGVAL